MDLAALNAKFGLAGGALVVTTAHGLPCVDVKTSAAEGRVYFQGGHVAEWKPAGHEPVLWMSGKSWFEANKPIRGGVPICFPWFGPNAEHADWPAHGCVRWQPWELEATRLGDAGKVALVMVLRANETTRKYLPFDFEIRHRITFGDAKSGLILKLEVTNTGKTPMTFEEALHTYLAVGDARQVEISGCEGVSYVDKVDNKRVKVQDGAIRFTGETDRVYVRTKLANTLVDPVLRRRITVQKADSHSTVVWNPWINKSKAMPDFGDDEWTGMCCIETANVGEERVNVKPGEVHQVRAIVSVEKLDDHGRP